jgi:hypothetical protein
LPQYEEDTIVMDGTVRHLAIGDQTMPRLVGPASDIGNLAPTHLRDAVVATMRAQTQTLITALGLRNDVYDVEHRLDANRALTIVGFGARAGGNLVSLRYEIAYRVDYASAAILLAAGRPVDVGPQKVTEQFAGLLVIHSEEADTLREVVIHDRMKTITRYQLISGRLGDEIRLFRTSADRLGLTVMASSDRSLLESVYGDPADFLQVRVHAK